jgi:polyisoprenoid-binding protein YceI
MKSFLVLLFTVFSFSGSALADAAKGTASWQAVGNPGFVKIDGHGATVTGDITTKDGKVSGTFECVMDGFTTDLTTRDSHMRTKYLEVAKFPKAMLKLDPVGYGKDTKWTGQLTLKGVTRPVSGIATVSVAGAEASFTVNLEDYPVGVPSFMGVTVAKEVNVKVSVDSAK